MNEVEFKSAGMQRAANRDNTVSKGKQFGIGNFYAWAMEKYPRMTLGQLEQKLPQLEREYGQEKTMRKAEPDMKPSVNSAFDDRGEEMKAKGIPQEGKSPHKKGTAKHKKHMAAMHAEAKDLERIKELAGIVTEDDDVEYEPEKRVIGHLDDEAEMIRKELYRIGKSSIEVYKMVGSVPEGDFPHWWQSKIVKAGEYLSNARDYLDAELNMPEQEVLDNIDQEQDDINPSGV